MAAMGSGRVKTTWKYCSPKREFGGQQFSPALIEPLFAGRPLALGAMAVAAGAIAGVRELAVVAPFDHAAHHRRAAGLDRLHQSMLMQGQRVGLPVGGAVLSKDVGQLGGWLRHQGLVRRGRPRWAVGLSN